MIETFLTGMLYSIIIFGGVLVAFLVLLLIAWVIQKIVEGRQE